MPGQLIPRGENVCAVRVYMGTDPDTGKRSYENRTVHDGKKQAQSVPDDLIHEKSHGGLTAESRRSPALHCL